MDLHTDTEAHSGRFLPLKRVLPVTVDEKELVKQFYPSQYDISSGPH